MQNELKLYLQKLKLYNQLERKITRKVSVETKIKQLEALNVWAHQTFGKSKIAKIRKEKLENLIRLEKRLLSIWKSQK
jgi:hypothetical protein